MRRYLVVFEKTESGYSAYAPDLPGCIASGRTKEETEQNMLAAIELHIEGLKAEGLMIPEGKAESEVIVIPHERLESSWHLLEERLIPGHYDPNSGWIDGHWQKP